MLPLIPASSIAHRPLSTSTQCTYALTAAPGSPSRGYSGRIRGGHNPGASSAPSLFLLHPMLSPMSPSYQCRPLANAALSPTLPSCPRCPPAYAALLPMLPACPCSS
ncbi:hypothetical protein EVG20_g10525 [Dentipellis fragilis]|uniref:Uncharacterized protein n=1 Tax=Dentipellis fragilis TaxID=205917 RepID=A0A4Y9XQA8_9AGAM|nr:hypothetical protein EVG20_g10525 [Dentipellis fragilis]